MSRRMTAALGAWIALVALGGVVAAATDGAEPSATDVVGGTTVPVASTVPGVAPTPTDDPAAGATTVPVAAATDPTAPAPTEAGTPEPTVPGTPAPTAPTAPGNPFPRPDAGTYTMHTVGTAQVLLQTQQIDETSDTRYEHVGDADVRQVGADGTGQGGMTMTLRYLPNEVQLLGMDLTGPGIAYTFVADPPVTYARLPLVAGDTWSWQLTDTGGRQTIGFSSSVRGGERIDTTAGPVDTFVVDTTLTLSGDLTGTMQLTSWIDPARRTSVRTRQVADIRYQGFRLQSDTTSDLVGFTAG